MQPDEPGTLHQLGATQSAAGDWQGAVDTLKRCVELAPRTFVARLRLGVALEQLGAAHGALVAYAAAVTRPRPTVVG